MSTSDFPKQRFLAALFAKLCETHGFPSSGWGKQTELAKILRVQSNQVSRALSGKVLLGPTVYERIIANGPWTEQEREALRGAWQDARMEDAARRDRERAANTRTKAKEQPRSTEPTGTGESSPNAFDRAIAGLDLHTAGVVQKLLDTIAKMPADWWAVQVSTLAESLAKGWEAAGSPPRLTQPARKAKGA